MVKAAPHVVFKGTVQRHGSAGYIELPFDPREKFGKVRAPVKVNGYTFNTTIAAMGGPPCIGIRTSYREAAGLEGGEKIEVRVALDEESAWSPRLPRARRVAKAVEMVRAMKPKKAR